MAFSIRLTEDEEILARRYMYMQTQAERVVRIPPSELGNDLDAIIGRIAQKTFEGKLGQDKSVTVLVTP